MQEEQGERGGPLDLGPAKFVEGRQAVEEDGKNIILSFSTLVVINCILLEIGPGIWATCDDGLEGTGDNERDQ